MDVIFIFNVFLGFFRGDFFNCIWNDKNDFRIMVYIYRKRKIDREREREMDREIVYF